MAFSFYCLLSCCLDNFSFRNLAELLKSSIPSYGLATDDFFEANV